ncbi:unnamed protein product [Gadus morhua 'NCC']
MDESQVISILPPDRVMLRPTSVGVHHQSASPLRLAGETAVCGTLATPTLFQDGRLPTVGRDVRKPVAEHVNNRQATGEQELE